MVKHKLYKKEYSDLLGFHINCAHGTYKDEWVDIVWTHCNIVLEIANQFVRKLENEGIAVDLQVLETGILLHDIGVYFCFDEDLNNDQNVAAPYITHGHIGYKQILKEGFSLKIARFAKTHTGVGITSEEIKNGNIPLPKDENYIPITLEEEILCFADKFHTKYPSFSTFEVQKNNLMKYGEDKGDIMERFKLKFGLPDLKILYEKYDAWNKKMDRFLSSI